MSVQVSYKKQTIFGICILLIIFSSLEFGARFYEFFIQECRLEDAETLSDYDYFLKKHICYDQQIIVYDNQPVFTISPNQHLKTININSDGFRGEEINPLKTNLDYRIVIIGGSTVFGTGLSNDEQAFPSILNEKFQEKYDNVEVINAGIASITSFEELYHIKEKIISLKPDMIIVYDGHNDGVYKKIIEPKILNTDKDELQFKDFQKYLRTPVVIYRYILLPIINSDINNELNLSTSEGGLILNKKNIDEKISNSIGTLWYERMKEFCEISNDKKIESVVILQPTLYHGNKPLSDYEKTILDENKQGKEIFEILNEKSQNLNNCSSVSDFSNVFDQITDGVYIDEAHLNYYGNKIIAEKIYETILPMVLEDISK